MTGYELPRLYIRNPATYDQGYAELRRTPQSGSWGTAARGTITPPINQEEEEAKDRGFLEEALARPGG